MSVSMSSESKPLSVKRSNKAASKAQRDLSMRSANVVERSAVMTNRAVLEKSLKLSDPVPEAGVERAVEIMRNGGMFRFDNPDGVEDEVSKAEVEIAEYMDFKYATAMNSCGSCIFLALKAIGVQPGDKVLSNAFTFTAVPSAIVHAGGEPVYVDCEDNYILDLENLEAKMISSGAKWLVVSHMRGKLSDMDAIVELCKKHNVRMIEDCAHSLGVLWNGVHSGHHGEIACISSQSYKMLNSGEGGFALTDDDKLAAKLIMYTGAYERLYKKHTLRPADEVFEAIKAEQIPPNYSLRMTQLCAAVIRPQILSLEKRVDIYDRRYKKVEALLNEVPHIVVPKQLEQVRPVCDTIQFNLVGMTAAQIDAFLKENNAHGVQLSIFGAKENARNFRNWTYGPVPEDLQKTEAIIQTAVDCRLPMQFEDSDFDVMCQVIKESMEAVMDC
jgi:dTDP-4-amino-4,6-dideoxygalactose transaminase